MNQFKDLHLLTPVYHWVFDVYFKPLHSRVTRDDLSFSLIKIARWYRTRGQVWTCECVKTHRLALTRYLAGSPLISPAGISMTKDGLPRLINGTLRDLIRQRDPWGIRLALTLLTATRAFLGGKKVDLSVIEEPSSPTIDEIVKEIPDFLQHYEIYPLETSWSKYHWSSKAGPNGPALRAAFQDWKLLPKDLKDNLETLGGENFKYIRKQLDRLEQETLDKVSNLYYNKTKGLIRRLSVKPDREAKSRIFAILDYYSQTVLKPLSDGLFAALRQIPSDRTYVQAGTGLSLQPSSNYHSLDLSNATDRFPLSLQQKLLEALTSKTKAEAWSRIMVGYPFDLKGQTVSYRAGQPMGAYSSWPLFTMAHHLVVWTAAKRAGVPAGFSNYAILGDDIVIASDRVAAEYRNLLNLLQVPISEAKSHTSPDVYEFAKRWFYKGEEVSPFPIHAIMETQGKYHLLWNSLNLALERGYGYGILNLRRPVEILRLWEIFEKDRIVPSSQGFRARLMKSNFLKFSLLANLPNGKEDTCEMAKKMENFFAIADVSYSCSFRYEKSAHPVAALAAEIVTKLTAKEAEALTARINRYNEAAAEILESELSGSDDQSELLDNQYDLLPVIGALGDLSSQALQSINELEESLFSGVSTGSIWESPKRVRVLSLPSIEGINPLRSSYRVAGARATLATRLASVLRERQRGLVTHG